jgi:hypothetical protein
MPSPCVACCLSPAELHIRKTADSLFETVNTETNCCGCKDQHLSHTETMLLLKVLQDESRSQLRMHSGLIGAIIEQLRTKTVVNSEGGRTITRSELADALLVATAHYQQKAMSAISAEIARDYAALDPSALEPQVMERGMRPGHGRQRLLPS